MSKDIVERLTVVKEDYERAGLYGENGAAICVDA